ncbi:MAG: hypothetical protein RIQ93_687 [Verrucomicrobiota bacterium]|jgi:hypothetical protein
MNPAFRPRLLLFLLAVWLVPGCSTSPLSRIDSNRPAYESWPIEVQEAVLSGQAKKGMTRGQVEMALGKPTEVIRRASRAGEDEVWIYRKGAPGSSILNNAGVVLGGGMGGVSVGTGGRSGRRTVTDEQEVVFGNGVVVRADPTL